MSALTACGGGGGGSAPALPDNGGTGNTTAPQGSAPATLALSLRQYAPVGSSARSRRPAYVSPATAQISLNVVSVNGQPVSSAPLTFAVNPGATGCSGAAGVVTCNLTANIPIGADVLAASTLDANGHTLGSSTIAATVLQNATNRIALAVGGNIANLQIYLSTTHFTPGTPGTSNVFVIPLDASGAQIVNPGNYNPSIAVTASSSAGGHLSLITDGANTGLSGTLASPNDQIVVSYDGGGTSGSSTIKADAGGGITASRSVSISAASLSSNASGAQFVSSNSYVFTASGQTGTIAVSGGTAPYTLTSSDPTLATVSPATPGNGPFTVTSVGYGVNGSGTITVTDAASNTNTIPVTFLAPAIAIAPGTCGGTSCTATGASYTIPLGGPTGALAPTTFTAGGGTGTFAYFFISSGTATSPYAAVSQVGPAFTVTPNGFGNDALMITSGNQSAYYAITASADQFGQSLPRAIGFMITQGTGKFYAATLPNTVANAVPTPAISGFMFNAGSPPSIDATPTGSGTGSFTFTNTSGGTSTVPYTVFGVSFATYAGGGAGNSTEAATPADEAITAAGLSDTVTVGGVAGTLSAASGNTGVATVNVVSNTQITVTAVAAGTTTITLSDSATGASASYTLSVTTTTIPITGRERTH